MSVNVCCTLRISAVSSGVWSTTSGASATSATRYGSVCSQLSIRTRWPPWIRTRSVPSGTRIMRATTPSTPTEYRSSGPGASASGLRAGDHRDRAVAAQDVVDQLDAALLPDVERDQHVGEGHGVAQRQHAHALGERRVAPVTATSRGPRLGAPTSIICFSAGSIGTACLGGRLTPHQRQLDAEHAVLVAGPGLLGAHVGGQLHDPAKAAALDLDLLVDLALLGRAAPAGEDQLASLDLEVQRVDLDARELGGDDRARRIGRVGDVDGGREAASAPGQAAAFEDVSEQLVHLPPHAVEVGEDVALRHETGG